MSLDYDYRRSPQQLDIITQAVCLAVSTCCVGMRMYTKLLVTKAPGWEDLACFLAWLGLISYAIISLEADKHGNGVHIWEVEASDLREFAKLANTSQIVYGPLIFVTKLSILLLYLRVFAPSFRSKTFFFIQLLIWFNFLFYLAGTIVKIFECTPRSKIWDKSVPGHCIDINILILTTSIMNVVSDFLILLTPIVCVWRLQMSLGKKIGTSAVFAAGSFGCVSSVMRLVVSVQNSATKDSTYDWFPEFLWTTAEVTSGIIASCLPALPTFCRHCVQKTRTMFSYPSTSGSGSITKKSGDKASRTLCNARRLDRNPSVTDLVPGVNSDWEMQDIDRRHVYQGTSYTTAKADTGGRSSAVERELEADGGILKVVEVDVESTPDIVVRRDDSVGK